MISAGESSPLNTSLLGWWTSNLSLNGPTSIGSPYGYRVPPIGTSRVTRLPRCDRPTCDSSAMKKQHPKFRPGCRATQQPSLQALAEALHDRGRPFCGDFAPSRILMARLLALASSYPRRRKRHTPANPSNAASTKSPGSLKVGICGTGGALCTVVDTLPALLAGFGS